jgi:hypothetical protein
LVKRATETIKTRHYRYTKKNPQAQKAIFKLDKGNVQQIISLSFPNKTEIKSVEIPKEKNPNLFTMHLGRTKIACYLTSEINREKIDNINKILKENSISLNLDVLSFKGKKEFEKGFIYDLDGNWSDSFKIADLKQLYSELGAFFKVVKTEKG